VKSWSIFLSFLFCMTLACAACAAPAPQSDDGSSSQPASEKPVYSGSVPIASLSPDEAELIKNLQAKNNAYQDVKGLVTAKGWRPLVCDQCKENVVGGDYEEVCSTNPGSHACRICDSLPELNSCSGDGYCLMQFYNRNSKLILKVGTYGAYGDVPNLMVTGWGFDTKASD
jgi:hypothetical protein